MSTRSILTFAISSVESHSRDPAPQLSAVGVANLPWIQRGPTHPIANFPLVGQPHWRSHPPKTRSAGRPWGGQKKHLSRVVHARAV